MYTLPAEVEGSASSSPSSPHSAQARLRDLRKKQAHCAVGHMFIWDLIADDPRCEDRGCMVSEDDMIFPTREDPRPYIRTWIESAAIGRDYDYVSLFHDWFWEPKGNMLVRIRVFFLQLLGYPREDLIYVNTGYGTQAYVLTSAGARKLMRPFHSGEYKLDTAIDDYIYWRYRHYKHGAKTYAERRYPLVHDWSKQTSLIYVNLGKRRRFRRGKKT